MTGGFGKSEGLLGAARVVAARIQSGYVLINDADFDRSAPWVAVPREIFPWKTPPCSGSLENTAAHTHFRGRMVPLFEEYA